MKKNTLLTVLFALIFAPSVRAIPMHNINLNIGISLPGETEIATYYGGSISESIRVYNFGLSYDIAPLEFVSIGAGCNLALRSFIVPYGTSPVFEDNVNFMAFEPFAQLRFYLPVMEGFDLYAGGGLGYAILMNSSLARGQDGVTYPINGGALTYKVGGGMAYNQGIFTAVLEVGYKSCSITPSTAVINPTTSNGMIVNMGGLFFTGSATFSFGSQKEAKNESDIKKQLDNEVNNLDTSYADSSGSVKTEESAATAPVEQKTDTYSAPPERVAEAVNVEKVAAENTPEPAETATKEPVSEPTPAPEKSAETAQIEENTDDTDGIIIISPGESETSELEKYITNKSKQFKPVAEEPEEQGDSGEDLVFNYGAEDAGIIVVEAESKGTVDRAGYVLVEKGGFISSNFTEDGFIYSLDEHKELLHATDFAYIKITAGIGAPKGKQFTIFDDSEEVTNQSNGEPMGKMIKFLGVAKVIGNIEDNIFKVQIVKSYEPIRNNYKIKARQDLKKYHKDINLKVRKKNLEVRAVIVKVKDDIQNLKSRDLVYIDAGIAKGLLPGVKMGIFRQTTDAVSGKEYEYDRLGTLIIINAMQASSVGLIVNNDGVIKVGDVVKTLGK
jgi:hypothetical protein